MSVSFPITVIVCWLAGRHQRYRAGGDHDSSAFSDSLGWSPPRRHHPADPLPSTESLLTQLESYEPQKLSKPIYLEDSQYPVQRLHEFSDDVELHKSLHRTLSTPNLTRHNEEESVEGAQVYEDDHWSSDEEDYRERIEPVTEGGEQEQTTTVTISTGNRRSKSILPCLMSLCSDKVTPKL